MIVLYLLLILTMKLCLGIPPMDLIEQFAMKHERTSVTFYIPDNTDMTKMVQHKMFKVGLLPTSYIFHNKIRTDSEVLRFETDLHVFILDPGNLEHSLNLFIGLYNKRTRSSREFWILDCKGNLNQNLKGINVDLDDDLYLVKHQKNTIEIQELYKIRSSFDLITLPFGNYTAESGLILNPNEKWSRRRNLQGVLLKVTTLESYPYISSMIPVQGKPGFYQMNGMFAEVFFALQEVMNFTFSLIRPADSQWGALQADGSWTGMVNLLATEQVDIAATDFTVTRARTEVMSFAQPITQIYHSLFIQNPAGTFNYMAYIEPLHYLAWIFIGVFCIVTPPAMFLTAK